MIPLDKSCFKARRGDTVPLSVTPLPLVTQHVTEQGRWERSQDMPSGVVILADALPLETAPGIYKPETKEGGRAMEVSLELLSPRTPRGK